MKLYYQGRAVVPVSARLERTYERAKGPKFLNSAPAAIDNLTVSEPELLQQYDVVLGIDTNTRVIGDVAVSISAMCRLDVKAVWPAYLGEVGFVGALELWNVASKPENVGWRLMIEGLGRGPSFRPHLRIAIVVDSDLGNIPAYNSRERPIERDFYLPPQFTLIYASADGGSDQFGNKLICLCDREAKRLLDHLEAVPEDAERNAPLIVADRPYTHFRQWLPN